MICVEVLNIMVVSTDFDVATSEKHKMHIINKRKMHDYAH